MQYTYDAVGNVKTITDGTNSNQVQTFGYDALDRLVSASTNAAGNGQYNESYAYDAVGNFTNKTGTSYTYQDAAHKHAATHLNGAQKYTYNANGDMTQRLENGLTYTQTFDSEHRLITVTASAGITLTAFAYDGDGQRVKQTEQQGATVTTTLYVGPMEVVITATGRITTSYYSAGSQLVALRVLTNTSGNTLSYLVSDHLSSASATLNSAGALVSRQLYLPYGGVRQSGNLPTDVGFTGQRLDGTGLMYYNARYYSGVSGRFISADTMVPGAGNPQAFNRYSYALGNPLKYTDPTGHCVFGLDTAICAEIAFELMVDILVKDLKDGSFDTPKNIRTAVVLSNAALTEQPFAPYRTNLQGVLSQNSPGKPPDLTSWLEKTMKANATGGVAAALRQANKSGRAEDKVGAYLAWAAMVKGGAPWDFKVELNKATVTSITLGGRDFRFDMLANIHYGYVGLASGFSLDELLGGASLAQIKDNWGNAIWDDAYDQAAIRLGAWLYQHPDKTLQDAIDLLGYTLAPPE